MSYNKETGMYEGHIYCITNKMNNKKYIGQTTVDVQYRFKQHLSANKKYAINNAIKKYGKENFVVEQLCKKVDATKKGLQNQLNKEEEYCIYWYETLCDQHGYNIDKGGGQASYFKKPVCQYDFYYNFISKYDSAMDADRATGIHFGDISKCCNKKSFSAGGFYWCFDGEKINIPNNKKIKNRPVVKYDMSGNQIEIFKCVNDISNDRKYNNRIRNCAKGRCNCVDGFVYRYYGDDFNKYKVVNKLDKSKPIKNKKKKKRTSIENINSKILRAVDVYDLDGNFLNTYNSIVLASEITGASKDGISNCCRGVKQKTCNNLVFRYHNEPFDLNLMSKSIRNNDYNRPIVQYNVFGETEKEFINIDELSVAINERKSDIYKQLIGKKYSIKNKIYRFKDESFDKYPIYIFGIEQYDMDGNFIKRWESCCDCENTLGFKNGSISKAISRKTSCGGYIFVKYGDDIFYPSSASKSVTKYDLKMNMIEEFDNIKNAKINSGYKGSDFKRFLNNNNNLYNGFYWIINDTNYCK